MQGILSFYLNDLRFVTLNFQLKRSFAAEPSVNLSVKSLCSLMACHLQPLISKLQAKLKHLSNATTCLNLEN